MTVYSFRRHTQLPKKNLYWIFKALVNKTLLYFVFNTNNENNSLINFKQSSFKLRMAHHSFSFFLSFFFPPFSLLNLVLKFTQDKVKNCQCSRASVEALAIIRLIDFYFSCALAAPAFSAAWVWCVYTILTAASLHGCP